MRWFVFLGLCLVAVARLAGWRSARQEALRFCAGLNQSDRLAPIRTLEGSPTFSMNGRWELSGVRWLAPDGFRPLTADVSLEAGVLGSAPVFGRQVRILGPFRCVAPFRNPGVREDGLFHLTGPRVSASGPRFRVTLSRTEAGWVSRAQATFRAWLMRPFRASPGVAGFVLAVWTGDTAGLPPKLVEVYQKGGLLQILALSGQHVAGMVLLVGITARLVLGLFARLGAVRFVRSVYPYFLRALPVSCSLLLLFTSNGLPPVKRTTAMAISLFFLRVRRLRASTAQVTASSVALLILWDPALACSLSFLLSAVATALLVRLMQSPSLGTAWKDYFFLATAMPVLVFPLSAFFFAKLSWWAPVDNLLISWVWDLVLIPFGFAAPVVLNVLPQSVSSGLLSVAEKTWNAFVAFHGQWSDWVAAGYRSCVRPTWSECVALEGMLLFSILLFRRRFR